jgi:glutathione S-transferase
MFTERLERIWGRIDQRLGEAPYFAGEAFTAADIIMGFPLTTMRRFTGRPLGPYKNLGAYLQRIGERPAYRRAMAKAEPGVEPTLS